MVIRLKVKASSSTPYTRSSAPRSSTKRKTRIDKELVNAVVEQIKTEFPEVIDTLRHTPPPVYVSEDLDAQCLNQISMAQKFLNENRCADLLHIKCLLRKMFPKPYHDVIDRLREQQTPEIIFQINGGNNLIAPKAQTAQQLNAPKEDEKEQ